MRRMTKRVLTLSLLTVLAMPVVTRGLGADHPKGKISSSAWPAGLAELVNDEHRVHGYFINQYDFFYFKGDTAALNAFLARAATVQDASFRVVLHVGTLEVRSPWDKAPRPERGNWTLSMATPWGAAEPTTRSVLRELVPTTKPKQTVSIGVWIGDGVRLDALDVPASITVESAGEIDAFIRKREKATTRPTS